MCKFYLIILIGLLGLVPVVRKWKFSLWMIFPYYALRLSYVGFLMTRGMIGNDVRGWIEHGVRIANGEMPGLDFSTPYGLLFNVIVGASAYVWAHPFMLALVFSLFEMAGVILFYDMMKGERLLPFRSSVMWLYLTSPLVMLNFGWDVQDEGILLFFVALCCLLWMRQKERLLPVAMVVAVVATKILAIIYLIPLLLMSRFRVALRFAACLMIFWSIEWFCGMHPFDLRFERLAGSFDEISEMMTSGNVWYLLTHVTGVRFPNVLSNGIYVAMTGGLALYCMTLVKEERKIRREDLLNLMFSVFGLSLMAFFKMSPPCYFLPVFLPICLCHVSHDDVRTVAPAMVAFGVLSMRNYWQTVFPTEGLILTTCLLVPMFILGICVALRRAHHYGSRIVSIPSALWSYFRSW